MTQGAANERLRAMVLEAAEKPYSELMAAIVVARGALLRELEGVTEAQSRRRPAPLPPNPSTELRTGPGGSDEEEEEAWCVAEVLRHLIQAEDGIAERVGLLARGEAAEGSIPGRLGGHEETPLAGLIEALSAAHERLLETVRGLDEASRLDTTAPHAFAGDLNAKGWLALWGFHLRSHARQVGEIKGSLVAGRWSLVASRWWRRGGRLKRRRHSSEADPPPRPGPPSLRLRSGQVSPQDEWLCTTDKPQTTGDQ